MGGGRASEKRLPVRDTVTERSESVPETASVAPVPVKFSACRGPED